jgi:hypothetical protein
MRKISMWFLIFGFITLGGCGPSRESVMKSWLGSSIDEVTTSWGAPDSKAPRADGGATYTWVHFRSAGNVVLQCRQNFVTDPSGKVVNWSYVNC